MMVTPFLISKVSEIVIQVFKEAAFKNDYTALKERQNHVIVCGYGSVGKLIAERLDKEGVSYLIVDNDLEQIKEAIRSSKEAYYGDLSKAILLDALHIEDAMAVIIAVENLEKKRLICEAISKYTDKVNLVVKVRSESEKEYLSDCHISTLINSKKEVANIIVDATMRCQLRT